MSEPEFDKKVRDKQGYIILLAEQPIGILRYNLFWDNTPFCNLLYIATPHQRQGYGTKLMTHWERNMKSQGHSEMLTSTRSDECAQYFYRTLGYIECGELFLKKTL